MSWSVSSFFGLGSVAEDSRQEGTVVIDVTHTDDEWDDQDVFFETVESVKDDDVDDCSARAEELDKERDEKRRLKNEFSGPEPYRRILREAMENIGRWSFGIIAIEIWTMNDYAKNGAALEQVADGYWRDPVFECKALERVENPSAPGYFPPKPLVPGLGVAGMLWSEASRSSSPSGISWRDLRQVAEDPDQPPNGRLDVLADVFGLATGIPFHSKATGLKGIVIFHARRAVDVKKLSAKENVLFLVSSAELLASIVSWRDQRIIAIEGRKDDLHNALIRVRNKILALYRCGALNFDDMVSHDGRRKKPKLPSKASRLSRLRKASSDALVYSKRKAVTTVKKIKGGGQKPPPPMTNSQCLFAFLGCFLSLLTLSAVNEAVKSYSGGDKSILLGPLGALVTMHYGLTAAPAAQPRNSFVGLAIATTISQCTTYIPENVLPVWIRLAISPAIGIVVTLGLGLPHPPAGAVAVVFASGKNNWWTLLLLLFGYVEAIIFAVFFINTSESRTYPMYWGIPTRWQEWWRDNICRKEPTGTNSDYVGDKLRR